MPFLYNTLQIQGVAEITPTFGGVTAWAEEEIQWWVWSRWLAAILPFSDNAMDWSDEHRGFVVETFFKNNESVIATQRTFRKHFRLGRRAPVPDRKTIRLWVSNTRVTGSTLKRKPPGRPRSIKSPENIQTVRASIEQSPRRSARKHAAALGISHRSVRRMLHQELGMHPYKFLLAQELRFGEKCSPVIWPLCVVTSVGPPGHLIWPRVIFSLGLPSKS